MADNNVNMMSSTCSQQMELLFFDTFSHENTEELNLDLVQFPCPVIIYEIRVIPLRTQVQADLPGGVRLGATNPSTFKLELFVNNLHKPNSSTFENIGVLQYKENNIQLKPNEDVPTDGLIIKGWYNTITLAVYGILTTVQPKPERCSPPPPPPPPPAQPPRTKVENRPSDQPKSDHRPHPVPQQQHPLDYIQQQIKLQQVQQRFQQHAAAHPPTALTPPVLTQPHLPVPSSQTEYRHGGTREVLHHYSSPRDKFQSSNDSRDRQEKGEREYLKFPPEPKEPFEQRDLHDDVLSRDSYDWDFRSRRNSRDSRERSLSRESSKEPRDFRENRERDVDRDIAVHGRDCDSDKDRERDRVRDQEWERERDCEREQDRSRERDRELERQREHEREIERQREREHEVKRERDFDHSPGLEYEERNARPRTPPSPRKQAESPKGSQSRSPHLQLPPESILRDEDVESGELEEELYESLSDENSPETLFPPEVEGDVDMQDDERASYDDISSDDDMIATEVDELQAIELYDLADDPWNFTTSSFNPLQCELVPLETFIDPSLSPYDVYNTVLSKEDKFERPEEAQVLLNMIQQLKYTEHHDKWVEAMESVPSLLDKGLSFLLVTEDNPDIVHKLLEWTMEGVDLDLAMKQPESVYKVRHLKMGIKLAGALSSYSPKVARMIIVKDIQHKLINLFVSPCMSFSIKLLIVQALDSTLRYIVGFNWFLGSHSLQTSSNFKQTCYQRVLKILLSKQLVRTTVALSCLLKKINIFEVLTTISSAVKSIVSTLPSNGEAVKIPHERMDLEMEQETSSDPLCSDREMENLANCLHEIHKVLVLAPDLIGQPNRSLPTNNSFDRGSVTTDPYPGLYYMFTNCGLLQAFSVLVSMPTLLQTPIFHGIENILKQLIVTQTGLLFLISNYEITNNIIRSLLQISTADESEETAADDSPAKQLALELIYHLKAIIYVDQLLSFNKKDSENKVVDEPKSLICLHTLYSMTFTSVVRETGMIFNLMGRDAVVRVLEMDDNLTALLYFVEASGDRRKELKRKKSVCTGFATDLIRMLIKNSTNVQMLERFSSRVIAVSEEEINSKLSELHEWLIPCQKHTCTYEELPNLINQLKQYSEDIQKLPQSLVTILRILHHLAVPTDIPFAYVRSLELKYKYAVIELYSADCLPVFMTILKKLIDKLLRPWQQGLPQNIEQWDVIFSILQPTIDIIKATIQYLIEARGSLFKDVTNVPILLELHTILCSAPVNNLFHSKILKVQKCVVDTLMSYTQAVLIHTDTEEALSESLWTMTTKEIFKHTAKAPYCYMGGMLLLSELLPLPLPLQSKETLTEEEVQLTINSRKLWSAHLHPLTTQFVQVISNFIVSGCQPLQNIIRRVCWQMTDLSAPSALILIKCILDQYLELNNKRTSGEEKKDNDVFKEEVVSSSLYNKILALLSWLVTQASAKSALIHILKSSNKNDEKYKEFLPSILNQLNVISDKTVHIQIQENILNIVLSLCDPEVTMITSHSPVLLLEELANSLPDKDILCQTLTALLDHIEQPEHSLTSVMSCVRTLVLLTYYDYSFYHVKRCIDENPSVINKLLHRLNNCFSKDNPDCLSTLSSTIELLHVLVYIDPEEVGNRTYTLSQLELQQILAWKTSEDHPLIELDKLLKNLDKDEVIDNLLETIGRILKFLDGSEITNIKAEISEFFLPVGQSLSSLYNQRAVFVLSDEERLSPTSWLANPCNDELDAESDVITTDVEELCKKYCGDFCLEEELHKGLDMATGEAIIVKPKRLKDIRRSQEGINIYSRGRGGARRPFVAPMRGRGIIHGMVSSGRPNDPFRSRPPNTSRPPSMHVDDFIKMEKHQGPEVSSHSTPPPSRRIEEPFRGRGRGFDRARGFNYRGRFFTPPGSYSRHDGVHPRSSIPELRGRGSKFSRPFSRGSHDFRSSMDSHGMRDRFSPRGRSPHWSVNKGSDQRVGNSSFRGRREPGRHVRSFTK